MGILKTIIWLMILYVAASIYLNVADMYDNYRRDNYCYMTKQYVETNGNYGWEPEANPPINCGDD